jgi:hypothetical protein
MSDLKEALQEQKRLKFLAKAEDDGSGDAQNQPVAPPEGEKTTQTTSEPPASPPVARKRTAKVSEGKAKPDKAVEVLPWDAADPRIPAHFTMRAKAPLHAKLVYVTEHSLGRNSLHGIAIEILEQGLNARIEAIRKRETEVKENH